MLLIHEEEHSRWPVFWLPTLKANWWSSAKAAMLAVASSTSKWRPLFKFATATHVLSVSSGLVPDSGEDGCGWNLSFSGVCNGPDCFFQFTFRVVLVKARDFVVFSSSFWVLLEIGMTAIFSLLH